MNQAASAPPRLHPAPQRKAANRLLLWFGVVGGPTAWILQHLLDYGLASYPCMPRGWPRQQVLSGWGFDYSVLWLIAVAGLLVSLLAGFAAWKCWLATRQERAESGDPLDVGEGRTRFMAVSGMFISAASVWVIAFEIIALFGVPLCWR